MEISFGLGGLAAFIFFIVVVLFMICFVPVKKREVIARSRQGLSCAVETNRVPTTLSLAEITSAAKGFNRNQVVGSAKVYKGLSHLVLKLQSKCLRGLIVCCYTVSAIYGIDCLRILLLFATMAGCLWHRIWLASWIWCCNGRVS